MEGMIGVQSVTILGAEVVALQHWIWIPSFTIQIRMICSKAASLCFWFVCLEIFFSGVIGRVEQLLGIFEIFMSCRTPFCLNK